MPSKWFASLTEAVFRETPFITRLNILFDDHHGALQHLLTKRSG